MSGFDAGWLDLREDADRAARDPGLLRRAVAYANEAEAPLIADLGCGTGSTVRVMKRTLSPCVRWRLVDSDPVLLGVAQQRCGTGQCEMHLRDLSAPEPLPIADARLVTASALLDLVSESWIDRLAAELGTAGAALYAGLIYDGRTEWSPVHPLDTAVLTAFNRDQQRDKGFGPALGPNATEYAGHALERSGFSVETAQSPWTLTAAEGDLVAQLIEGIVAAAADEGSIAPPKLDGWRRFRLDAAASGGCMVGHYDLFAWPFQASAAGRKQSGSKAQSKMNSPPRS